jgi:AcrR family transcriptional regulator
MANEDGAAGRILDAADELFSMRGFSGVSVRDVAELAGVKKASVFYHYKSKDELFERVLERYYAAHARVLEATETSGNASERLHRLIDAYLDFIEDHHRYVSLVQIEIASGSAHMTEIARGLALLYERVHAILEGVVPGSGPLSARQFFLSVAGIVNTYYLYAPAMPAAWGITDPLAAGPRRERREHVHWIVDAMLARLGET